MCCDTAAPALVAGDSSVHRDLHTHHLCKQARTESLSCSAMDGLAGCVEGCVLFGESVSKQGQVLSLTSSESSMYREAAGMVVPTCCSQMLPEHHIKRSFR
jgi:hypothetical protein